MNLDNLDKRGIWWFPENYENKFSGSLQFNREEGGSLSLTDSADKLLHFPYYDSNFLLLGELIEQSANNTTTTKVTVMIDYVSARKETYSKNESKISISLRLRYIFLGANIHDKRLEFDKIRFSLTNLDVWLFPPYDLEPYAVQSYRDQNRSGGRILFRSIEITIRDECKIQLHSSPSVHQQENRRGKGYDTSFFVESIGEKSFENYLKLEQKITDFLNFIISEEVVLQSLEGFYKEANEVKKVAILYRSSVKEKMHKLTIRSLFLASYHELRKNLEKILNNWFDMYSKHGTILDLYFGVMYNIESYLSNNFLMLFTGLEVYHRAIMERNSETKKQKLAFKTDVVTMIKKSGIPSYEKENLIEWISDKEPLSSKERLGEIYERFKDILPHLSKKIEGKDQFLRKIVKYRNALVHGTIRFDKLENNDLFWQYKNLQLLLQLCILLNIGFSMGEIRKIYLIDKLIRSQ